MSYDNYQNAMSGYQYQPSSNNSKGLGNVIESLANIGKPDNSISTPSSLAIKTELGSGIDNNANYESFLGELYNKYNLGSNSNNNYGFGTPKGLGDIAGALGNIGGLYMAFKNYGLQKNQMKQGMEINNRNYEQGLRMYADQKKLLGEELRAKNANIAQRLPPGQQPFFQYNTNI